MLVLLLLVAVCRPVGVHSSQLLALLAALGAASLAASAGKSPVTMPMLPLLPLLAASLPPLLLSLCTACS
jgi:hypothetical protein